MSSKNNVNPDHYKTAGRQRQGENIIQEIYKRRYAQSKAGSGAGAINFISGRVTPRHPRAKVRELFGMVRRAGVMRT
jgi:hypothetical protein